MTAERSARTEPELRQAWQLLMGLVLDQRFRWAEVAEQLGISQAGLRALLAINPGRPAPMRELAGALNCDPSSVTSMVDDLEQAGYAERRPGTTDRRVKAVTLTASGLTALDAARDGLLAPPAQLSRLSGQQQRQLAHLLRAGLDVAGTHDRDLRG